ncbi:aldo/keto reductase [Mitsuaria sp. WAJ17]|uniref:aldo/keto reductase n=1 Tax=Mitsuaria sp. WAJ17 TaxID=2761452 RepID=UPI001C7E2114|nr:aldo/keto reductase [Mitsuaria sp. WAJ17]
MPTAPSLLRPFGRSGLQTSALGFGAMHLNDDRSSEAEAGALLNAVLDLGVTLIDTARSYGLSEERIGRHLAHRRSEFLLSTKLGYGVEGVPDWTYDCIVQGVERALRLMRTDVLDIAHLHSCPLETLLRGEVIRALDDCRRAGKIRVAAYSGENAELDFSLAEDVFGAVQISVSVCDQGAVPQRLAQAGARGVGVIAKRPLAGAIWRHAQRPDDFAEGRYWDRWQAMRLAELAQDLTPDELALRFAAWLPGVDSVIAGTRRLDNLKRNLAAIAKGPLPPGLQQALLDRFAPHAAQWPGLI